MIIVAAGDSFVWGSELADSPNGAANSYSRRTYPALLAQQAGLDYVCAAYPGNANNAITRTAIATLDQTKNAVLIANWTYPQRREFYFGNQWSSITSWHTAHEEFSKSYFQHVGDSEYYEVYSVLKEIVMLQHYCEINHVPYLFTTADNHFYQREQYDRTHDSYIDSLYRQINWNNWFWFEPGTAPDEVCAPRGFYQWAIENKYTCGPQGHPLEQAHQAAANLMKDQFNEMVTKHIQ